MDKTLLPSKKFKIKDKPFINLDRSFSPAKTLDSGFNKSVRNSSVPRGSKLLEPIREENQDKTDAFKEKFSYIERGLHTRMLGGGPMYPIPTHDEKMIQELDTTARDYKLRYRKRL